MAEDKFGTVEPRVIRGELPDRRPPALKFGPTPWDKHIELARAIPSVWRDGLPYGGWVLCAEQKKRGQGPKERRHRIINDKRRLQQMIERRFPLDRFQLRILTVEGTAADMELYMRFLFTLSPEEDALDRKQRRERYEAWQRKVAENEARRALKSRPRGASQN